MAPVAALVRLAAALAVAIPASVHAQSPPRQIAPEVVAPPDLDPDDLVRQPPRGPLGELGPAGKKPKRIGKPESPKLFKPLATAAGVVEARGITLTVADIDVVAADETCDAGGKAWPCGIRARTAFRSFLRGRALDCGLPPDLKEGAVSARCTLGKQDVGTWLVSNGWARAASGGPYVQAEEKAKTARKGIFGSPPDLGGLMPEPAPFTASASDQAIIETPAGTTEADAAVPVTPPPAGVTPPASPQGLY